MSVLSSLSNRIFLASALLAVLSIGAAVLMVNLVVTRQAEAELDRSLHEAAELVGQFQTLLFEHLVTQARVVADLPRLKAAVDLDHAPTVEPIVREYAAQLEADLIVVTNRGGAPLALVGDPGVAPGAVAQLPGVRDALAGKEQVALWQTREGPMHVVSVPIFIDPGQPEVFGTFNAGLSLSRRLADRIKAITRTEVVFLDESGVLASTLGNEHDDVLRGMLGDKPATHVQIGGEEYVGLRRSLVLARQASPGQTRAGRTAAGRGSAPAVTAAGVSSVPQPHFVVLRSRTEHLRFLRTLHSALAVTALLAVLIATLSSYVVAQTVTRPIRALTATMREMAATGDLKAPAPAVGARGDDEDARLLTSTFQTLTASLARFQREAAQRERLSSLGRLSTVLAHEVRNPLMIMKASLRSLKRGATQPDAIASKAIADIEGEVTRLDRLVHEVLDYARPITFTREPVDVDRLVADAADAVMAGQPDPRVSVGQNGRVGQIYTDGDRLRQALVNVLSNARDAVIARHAAAGAASSPTSVGPGPDKEGSTNGGVDVEVSTDAEHDDGHVRIVVRDRGQGIPAEHVGRIFEPFFTTRRTGSGIGLAITRNIVEGLGGTITIDTQEGSGTTVSMTLPRDRKDTA